MPPQAPHIIHVFDPFPNPTFERLHPLEEKVKVMEVHNTLGLDDVDMCLVLGFVIPQKFKMPDFEKYKGVSYPRTHIRAYCRKMVAYVDNVVLLIYYSQDNFSGASLERYMQLGRHHVQSWRNLD